MKILIHWFINGLAVLATAYILPGVHVPGIFVALVVALVLGIINTFLKPVILLLTLPINLLTLGLFTLIINALMILLVEMIVPGFRVDGFIWALLFSIVLSLVNYFLSKLL